MTDEQVQQVAIRTVEVLAPQPGDVILITLAGLPSNAQRQAIGHAFKAACKGCDIAILPDGCKAQVVRKEALPAGARLVTDPPPPSLDMGTTQVVG